MLTVDNETKELGLLPFGKPFNFKYSLSNKGSEKVEVTKLVKGCGSCTKASCDKTIIEPNGTANINVTFTPGSTGINKKTIQVLYKIGPLTHNMGLVFKATVK